MHHHSVTLKIQVTFQQGEEVSLDVLTRNSWDPEENQDIES